MNVITHDTASRSSTGVVMAIISAVVFGLSGALARPLMDAGWSSGAVVLPRIATGAIALAPLAARELRGRWQLVRRNGATIVLYGILAVAATQFCYFSAVATMDVGPALLIEYAAPIVVVCWMWAVHRQRPTALTTAGLVVCIAGLVLVLDLVAGADVDTIGVLWACGAMVGLASYFIMSAGRAPDLPPTAPACGGMVVAAVVLGALGAVGLLPLRVGADVVSFSGIAVPAWLALVLLGVVTTSIAYATGVIAARRLGARPAALLALIEVGAAVAWAALLLGQVPGPIQLVGGALVLAGVICAKLGERRAPADSATPVTVPST